MRSIGFVASLAVRRFSRGGSGLAAVLGVAAAAAVLAAILVGSTVARDRSVTQAISRLPASNQSVRAVWFGVPASDTESYPSLAASAAMAFSRVPLRPPVPIVLVRESTVGGRYVGLAAVDGLAPHVRLQRGRLPHACRPQRCEVLRLRGVGRLPDVPGLRIVEVGRATLRSGQLFGDFLEPTDNALGNARLAPALQRIGRYHRPAPGPLIVAEGVAGLVSSPVLARTYRSYAWVSRLGEGVPRAWDLGATLAAVARIRSELTAISTSWSVIEPEQELRDTDRSTTTASRRLLLIGGEGVALLVAFAILAAGALRADLERARRRLTWYGARRSQTLLLSGVESALIGVSGTAGGWLIGTTAGAIGAASAGAPVGAALQASALSPGGIALALGLVLVATCVVWGAASLPDNHNRRVGMGEVVAGSSLLLVAVVLLGGSVDDERLARGGGPAVLLLLLPGLVALIAAIGAARATPVFARLLVGASRPAALRLAANPIARRVGTAGLAVAFLTLAVGLAFFAETYRATLSRGEHDQAAFTVPTDLVVREDLRALVPVLEAAPLETYAALARPGSALPVMRVSASAGRSETVSAVTVLGVGPKAINQLPLWHGSWGLGQAGLAELIAKGEGTTLQGAPIAGDTLRFRLGPTLLTLRLVVRGGDGRVASLTSGPADAHRPATVTVSIPAEFRGGSLVAIVLVPPRIIERGSDEGVALQGSLALRAEGVKLDGWVGTGGASVNESGDGFLRVSYTLTPQHLARLRPRQTTDTDKPTVVATEGLAALTGGLGSTLPLRVGGELIDVEIGGIVSRFPGIRGEAVVGNLDALKTAIDTEAPGSASVNELWLDIGASEGPRVSAALAKRPFSALRVTSRDAVEKDARRDPLGHGTLVALVASAAVSLLLAIIGLALAVRADLRDERGELVELEAQGTSPTLLLRVVRVRALLVLAFGLVGGALAGAALALLVTRVIRVTARAGNAEPPLVIAIETPVVVAAVLGLVVAAAVVIGFVTRDAFADPRGPGRVGGST